MIYDQISALEKYRGIHKNLDRTIDFLMEKGLENITADRTDVDGDTVFIRCFEIKEENTRQIPYEMHKRYADLQVIVRGSGALEVCTVEQLTDYQPYDEATDNAFNDEPVAGTVLALPAGTFCLLLPGEGHRSIASMPSPVGTRKLVCKVLWD